MTPPILNSMPARFVHVDISDATAEQFCASLDAREYWPRAAAICLITTCGAPSPLPAGHSLTVCDARSVAPTDLIYADAIFDEKDKPEWSFEGWVVAQPTGIVVLFFDMTRGRGDHLQDQRFRSGAAASSAFGLRRSLLPERCTPARQH